MTSFQKLPFGLTRQLRKLCARLTFKQAQADGVRVYADMCGNFKALGLFAYAAHILSISNAAKKTTQMGQIASSVAPVSSKSVASESVGFARSSGRPNSNGFDDLLASTVYGQEYLGYWNAASQGAVMV